MSVTKEELGEKIREYRTKSGKTQQDLAILLDKTTASISDLERGKVNVTGVELSKISDYLNVPVSHFFQVQPDDEYTQKVLYAIQSEPKETRANSIKMVMMYLEIQSLAKKLLAKPDKSYSPDELGDLVTKILTFQNQYKLMTSQLDSVVDSLLQVLNDNGITLPNN